MSNHDTMKRQQKPKAKRKAAKTKMIRYSDHGSTEAVLKAAWDDLQKTGEAFIDPLG